MVENVWARGIQADACDFCIQLQTDYKGVTDHRSPPDYRNFHFEDVHCGKVRRTGISSVGIRAKPIDGVYLRDITIDEAAAELQIDATSRIELRNVRINGRVLHQTVESKQR
jgi:hypothetical protein